VESNKLQPIIRSHPDRDFCIPFVDIPPLNYCRIFRLEVLTSELDSGEEDDQVMLKEQNVRAVVNSHTEHNTEHSSRLPQ